jgi:hypothetical protein
MLRKTTACRSNLSFSANLKFPDVEIPDFHRMGLRNPGFPKAALRQILVRRHGDFQLRA